MNSNITAQITKTLVIVGDNFIAQSLYNDYKRYGKVKIIIVRDISHIKTKIDFIIDCSFNERTQNLSLTYCRLNNIEKILLINHWERKNLPTINTIILQSILYDVYGTEHNSFIRQGPGNNYESEINYCTLISETIRRIHEAKAGGVPIVYIPYGENKIKCIHIDNIYEPINFMLTNLKKNGAYAVYDEEKYVSSVIDSIEKVIEYKGLVVFENNKSIYTQHINKLDFNYKRNNFEYSIKRIYNYLCFNNVRFMSDSWYTKDSE
jgi:hypothetical protein